MFKNDLPHPLNPMFYVSYIVSDADVYNQVAITST